MSESEQLAVAKKASIQKKNKQVQLPDPSHPNSGVFTSKFVWKDGQPILNIDHPSLDPKSAYDLMDSIFTDPKVTPLIEKSVANQ